MAAYSFITQGRLCIIQNFSSSEELLHVIVGTSLYYFNHLSPQLCDIVLILSQFYI